jgi:peptidoglycan/xylan/chitin deacetylase (PgdA/CDA1 family)
MDRALLRSPLQRAFRWRASRSLGVLAYHAVEDPDTFTLHLEYVRRHCQPVSLEETLAAVAGRKGLPRHAVLLTFDDANQSVLDIGRELLSERGIPGVAFVVAGHLDGDQPFWWNEVEELVGAGGWAAGLEGLGPDEAVRRLKRVPEEHRRASVAELRATSPASASRHPHLRSEDLRDLDSAGIAIGNHTMTHPLLPRCSNAGVRTEIAEAHAALTAATGRHPRAFAYPNGDWDLRAERVLTELEYGAGFLFDHALARIPIRHPLRISRVRVGSATSIERLALVLSGVHPMVHRARSRLVGRVP